VRWKAWPREGRRSVGHRPARRAAILGFAKADRIRQLRLRDEPLTGAIDEKTLLFLDEIDDEAAPVVRLDAVAFFELHTAERCAFQRILPVLIGCREEELHASERRLQHNAKAKLRLAIADPTLTRKWSRDRHEERGSCDREALATSRDVSRAHGSRSSSGAAATDRQGDLRG
jgi:hypothetical protein